ncbi:hypothetical protein TrLO_g6381 [Triparma laevis f. longispina]|uniref:Autophagy-related protein 9 n=1 Tax=Triparma laevis f. longispina TaxID=1714387 RepID=A0A9W7A4S6_9STRA|nr:hypothetical protein TrLO_g6381 [Triparma laevis f. longispina]
MAAVVDSSPLLSPLTSSFHAGFTSLPSPPLSTPFTPVPSLDTFLHSLYSYYLHGGYYGTISSILVELSVITVSGVCGSLVIFFVDWKKVNECKSESTCDTSYTSYLKQPSTLLTLTSSIYLILCFLYLMLRLHSHFLTLFRPHYNLRDVRDFYNQVLRIPEKNLANKSMSWAKVEENIVRQSRSISVVLLTPSHIRLRLTRSTNYLSALLKQKKLPLTNPKSEYTMSSNFAVWYCVFSQLFTNNHRLKKLDPTSLERNLKILSIIMLLLSPFLAVFQLTLFTFQNFRSDKTKLSLDAVHLTTYSSIFLREYNELTHEFKKRTGDLEEFKEFYETDLPTPMVIGAKRIVSFFCGSALAVLAIVGAVSESSLLHVLILGQPLIFWGVVGTVVYSVSKGETRKQYDDFNVNEVKEELLRKGGEKIRYYPEWWKNRAGEVQVKKEVKDLVGYKWEIAWWEVAGAFLGPLVCWRLGNSSEAIIEWLRDVTIEVEGVGDVCRYGVEASPPPTPPEHQNLPKPPPNQPNLDRGISGGSMHVNAHKHAALTEAQQYADPTPNMEHHTGVTPQPIDLNDPEVQQRICEYEARREEYENRTREIYRQQLELQQQAAALQHQQVFAQQQYAAQQVYEQQQQQQNLQQQQFLQQQQQQQQQQNPYSVPQSIARLPSEPLNYMDSAMSQHLRDVVNGVGSVGSLDGFCEEEEEVEVYVAREGMVPPEEEREERG